MTVNNTEHKKYMVEANSDIEAIYKAEALLNRSMIGQGAYSHKIDSYTPLNKYDKYK